MPIDWLARVGVSEKPQGLTGARLDQAADSYLANLQDTGRATANAVGADGAANWLDNKRQENADAADAAAYRARNAGAVDSISDVHGVKDFANYAAGLGIQASPYVAEMMATGMLGRAAAGARLGSGLLTGSVAGEAGSAARVAAEAKLASASRAAATVGSYPSSVGMVLDAQRQQTGQTDDTAAAIGGIPMAALNAISPSHMAAAKMEGFTAPAIMGLDKVEGLRGGLARMGASGVTAGAGESINMLAREGVNQYFGRMAVDPNESMTSDAAIGRYGEAAAAGFTMGAVPGAFLGGWRKSGKTLPVDDKTPGTPAATQSADLLADSTATGGIDYKPLTQAELATMKADNLPSETTQGAPVHGNEIPFTTDGSPVVGTKSDPAAGLQMPTAPGRPGLDDVMQVGPAADVGKVGPGGPTGTFAPASGGNVAANGELAHPDLGLQLAMQRAQEAQRQEQEKQQQQQKGAQEAQAFNKRMADNGFNPQDPKQATFFKKLEDALGSGAITQQDFHQAIGNVRGGVDMGVVMKEGVAPKVAEAKKAADKAKKLQDTQESSLTMATAEEKHGLLMPGASETVRKAIADGQDGKAALQAERKNKREAEAKAKADAAEAATKPAEVAKPAEAPATDPKPAEVSAPAADKPAQSSPAGEAAAPAPAAKKSRVVAQGAISGEKPTESAPKATVDDEIAAVRAEIARKKAALAEASNGVTKLNSGVPIPDSFTHLLPDYIKLAGLYLKKAGATFAGYVKHMLAADPDLTDSQLRTIHTQASKDIKTKRVEVATDKGGEPVVSYGKRGDGTETMTAKMAGKHGYAVAEKVNGQWVLKHQGASDRVLGESNKDALATMPYAFHEAQAETRVSKEKAAPTSTSKDVAFEPNGTATVGGQLDFGKLQEAAGHHPAMLKAIRYYLGVDDDGSRSVGDLTQKTAAKKAGLGENSQAGLSKALRSLGITKEVRDGFYRGEAEAAPLPGHEPKDEYSGRDLSTAMDDARKTRAERTVSDEVREERSTRLSDEHSKDDAEQGDEWFHGMSTTSSAGGSVGDIAATKGGLIHEQSWYEGPITKAEGDIQRVPTDKLAEMTSRARDYTHAGNAAVFQHLLNEVARRYKEDPAGVRAAIEKVERENGNFSKVDELRSKAGRLQDVHGEGDGSAGENEGRRKGDASERDAAAELGDEDTERPLDGSLKFSKSNVGPERAGPITVDVNGHQLAVKDPETALKHLADKIERHKALLKCLMG